MKKRLVIINRPVFTTATGTTLDNCTASLLSDSDLLIISANKNITSSKPFKSLLTTLNLNADRIKVLNVSDIDLTGKHTALSLVDVLGNNLNFLNDYTEVHLIGGFITANIRYNNKVFNENTILNMNIGMTFGMFLRLAVVIKARMLKLPVYEFIDDPQEYRLSSLNIEGIGVIANKSFFSYDYLDLTYSDFVQISLINSNNAKHTSSVKTNEFCMGYTYTPGLRTTAPKHLALISDIFSEKKIFVRNSKDDSTFIHRRDYLRHIAQSKYTAIIPPYDPNSFSIFRLMESLLLNCLPIIHPDCVIHDVEKTYMVDLTPLVFDGVSHTKDVNEKIAFFKNAFFDKRPIPNYIL